MDNIQVYMGQIPAHLKTALKLITQAGPSMIKAMLPRTLSNIGRYANDSATVARALLHRFETLQYLLQEIFEVSTLTDKENRDVAEKLHEEVEEMRRNQTYIDSVMNNLGADHEIARQNLLKARQDYHKAMMNLPGGQWDAHAWQVYAANRPSQSCSGFWFWHSCTSLREPQFHEYSQEAKRKAEEALKILQAAVQRSKELFNQQMNKQNELVKAISSLAMMNFAEISTNETIKLLLNAAQQLLKVQGQWSRFIRFFSRLAIETEHTQNVIMENFLSAIAEAQAMDKPLDPMDQTLYTTMLVESATDIDRDSHQLFLIAKTYSNVSSEFMVNQVAGLSGFLILQTDAERNAYLQAMANKTTTISNRVKQLATERQIEYELANLARQEQYLKFLQEAALHEVVDIIGGIGIGKRREMNN
ncbi:unnamed protein product [Rotaria sp. Silwood1]|nr:unnamed protein product [Rotaria sp. Silwood1]